MLLLRSIYTASRIEIKIKRDMHVRPLHLQVQHRLVHTQSDRMDHKHNGCRKGIEDVAVPFVPSSAWSNRTTVTPKHLRCGLCQHHRRYTVRKTEIPPADQFIESSIICWHNLFVDYVSNISMYTLVCARARVRVCARASVPPCAALQ